MRKIAILLLAAALTLACGKDELTDRTIKTHKEYVILYEKGGSPKKIYQELVNLSKQHGYKFYPYEFSMIEWVETRKNAYSIFLNKKPMDNVYMIGYLDSSLGLHGFSPIPGDNYITYLIPSKSESFKKVRRTIKYIP